MYATGAIVGNMLAPSKALATLPMSLFVVGMAGGVFAGVLGPQLVSHSMDLGQPHTFAATYLAQAAVAIVSALVLLGVHVPAPTAAEVAGGRPLGVIARPWPQPWRHSPPPPRSAAVDSRWDDTIGRASASRSNGHRRA